MLIDWITREENYSIPVENQSTQTMARFCLSNIWKRPCFQQSSVFMATIASSLFCRSLKVVVLFKIVSGKALNPFIL